MNGRILVIEENSEILELLKLTFKRSDYNAIFAASGEDGLEKVNNHEIDLVPLV